MDAPRAVVYATVALILGVTLASGPLVGAVDFTTEREESFAPGTGHADVTVTSVPDRASLEKGQFGSGAYYLRVPDATVRIAAIEGQPMLVYKVRIPDLGFTRGTTHFLDGTVDGEMALSMEETTLDPDEIDREAYAAELVVLVRGGEAEDVLYRGNVTVSVEH